MRFERLFQIFVVEKEFLELKFIFNLTTVRFLHIFTSLSNGWQLQDKKNAVLFLIYFF